MTTPHLPLQGITVLDLSRALAGPYCSALLADLGANVIKVESSKNGDITRLWPPFEDDHSLYFESTNRNKSSLALDFYSSEGQQVLRRLVANSDVLLENFRPGVLQKMGLDHEKLRKDFPQLVTASITGFGTTGPLKNAAGLDQVAQGMSGLMSITGPDDNHPYRFGVPIIDMTSGIFTALGIVSALFSSQTSGHGHHISTSLLESALALAAFQGQRYLSTGELPQAQGNDHASITPYGVFQTADTPLIIAVGNEKQWADFCDTIEAPELLNDPRFSTGRSRTENRDELKPVIEKHLEQRPASHWLASIRDAGIPCGPIYNYAQTFADEQVDALQVVKEVTRDDGSRLPLVRGPLSIDGAPTDIYKAPPKLGSDTLSALEQAGFSTTEIEQLLSNNTVAATANSHQNADNH